MKRLCAFLDLVRVGSIAGCVGVLVGVTLVCSAKPGWADDQQLDLDFLKLPAYDVVWVGQAPSEVLIGDRLKLEIKDLQIDRSRLPNLQLKSPPGTDELFDLGWILIPDEALISEADQKGTGNFRFYAVPLRRGELSLPTLALQETDGKNLARTYPFQISVGGPEQTDPSGKPIEPPEILGPVSVAFPWVFYGSVASSLLLILALIGYLLWRYARKDRPIPQFTRSAEPEVPFDAKALRELERLERNRVYSTDHKKHYFGISEILKEYIGKRYKIDAPEMTSAEMVGRLRELSLKPELVDEVRMIFEGLDLVKFTDHRPTESDGLEMIEISRRFVQKTRPRQVSLTEEIQSGPQGSSTEEKGPI